MRVQILLEDKIQDRKMRFKRIGLKGLIEKHCGLEMGDIDCYESYQLGWYNVYDIIEIEIKIIIFEESYSFSITQKIDYRIFSGVTFRIEENNKKVLIELINLRNEFIKKGEDVYKKFEWEGNKIV